MTLVGLLVAIAIFVVVFVGLLSAFETIISMIGRQKASSGALALANERMEYVRSLPYNTVGTIGGIVAGPIPQVSTTTLNGVTYVERVDVRYFDDDADGQGALDSNTITADYKVVRVEYSWDEKGVPKELVLISNIVPNGIETLAGGGTLTINVFDALAQPVPGASVTIVNNTTTSTINTTVFTNASGQAMLPGAPAASQYQISVSKLGYSTDATYSATGTNANPNPPHVAVVESGISTMSFSIDETSHIRLIARDEPVYGAFSDTFSDSSLVASTTNTQVSTGEVILAQTAGLYDTAGSVTSTTSAPTALHRWLAVDLSINAPGGTDALVRLYSVDAGGTYTIIPDGDVPGNSAGFGDGLLDISTLATSTYSRLALVADLSTTNTAITPELEAWTISYEASVNPISGVAIDVAGNKSIGSTAALVPIPKNATTAITGTDGRVTLADMEWDSYTISIDGAAEGYDIAEACSNIPLAHNPGEDSTVLLTLLPNVAHSLRVTVVDGAGNPIPEASVTLERTGFNTTLPVSVCGQAFFNSGVVTATDYQLTVAAPGFTSEVLTNVEVADATSRTVILLP